MYIFVVFMQKKDYYKDGPNGKTKARLEEASGERCLIVPYEEFDMSVVRELNPRAIVLSGFGGRWQDRPVKGFYGANEVLHETEAPMLCLCGGHQLVGYCFNGDIRKKKVLLDEPMRNLKKEEDTPRRGGWTPKYDFSRYFQADGYFPITQVKSDPLFRGLPKTMMMRCWHFCEVKKIPPEFEVIARSGHCRVEAMRHKSRVLYGTQFHPEMYDAPWFHGRRLLANFAEIVDGYWSRKRTKSGK